MLLVMEIGQRKPIFHGFGCIFDLLQVLLSAIVIRNVGKRHIKAILISEKYIFICDIDLI